MSDNQIETRTAYALNLATASVLLNFLTLFIILLRWNLTGGVPEWDPVSISLTVLEIFLVVIALGGFWIFRGIVKEHAEKIAKAAACEIAEAEALETAEVVATRVAEAAVAAKLGMDDDRTSAQVAAFGENGDGT